MVYPIVVVKDPLQCHNKILHVDYSQNNLYTELDAYPLPRIEDMNNTHSQYTSKSLVESTLLPNSMDSCTSFVVFLLVKQMMFLFPVLWTRLLQRKSYLVPSHILIT